MKSPLSDSGFFASIRGVLTEGLVTIGGETVIGG